MPADALEKWKETIIAAQRAWVSLQGERLRGGGIRMVGRLRRQQAQTACLYAHTAAAGRGPQVAVPRPVGSRGANAGRRPAASASLAKSPHSAILPRSKAYANRTPAFGARGRSGVIGRARKTKIRSRPCITMGPGFPEEAPWRRRSGNRWRKNLPRFRASRSATRPRCSNSPRTITALDELETDVGRFATLHDQSDDLQAFIRSPVYTAEEQVRAIEAVLDQAGIGGHVANFFKVVAGNRRLFAMPEIIAAFRRAARQAPRRGHRRGDQRRAAVATRMSRRSRTRSRRRSARTSRSTRSVDPSLIGGLIVKVGSRMIDASLRTKLSSLKLAMKEVG